MDKIYYIIILLILITLFLCNFNIDFFDIKPPPLTVKKVAVIFPYRDQVIQNRSQHLKDTINYYTKLNLPNIDYYIIEQGNDKKFNRGILINAGHDIIKKSGLGYQNEVHHDIDVQADNTLIKYFYSDNVIACKKAFYDHFFGTMSVMPLNIMDKVNGYSNKFWGWGVEDDNLSRRITSKNIPIYNADPSITNIKTLPHKNAWELNIVNKDRHIVDDLDVAEGYKSGLSDLKYIITSEEKLSDHVFKITIDF